MADLHWLASYPKSGNTWMRVLLANCVAGGTQGADINALAQYGMSGAFSRAVFDQYCAFKASTLPVAVIDGLRPDIYRALAAHAPMAMVMKVHDAWRLNDRGEALFPSEVTGGVIYVVRNVLDVVPSAADHWGVDVREAISRLCDPRLVLTPGGDALSPSLPQFMGTWSHHVTSWIDRSQLPVHVVRYEDLMRDTAGTLAKVLAFLRWNVPEPAIATAVGNAAFERLQDRERSEGFREKSSAAKSAFFRRGKVGSWEDELSPDLVRQLVDAHGDTMRRFGYLDARGEPVRVNQ